MGSEYCEISEEFHVCLPTQIIAGFYPCEHIVGADIVTSCVGNS